MDIVQILCLISLILALVSLALNGGLVLNWAKWLAPWYYYRGNDCPYMGESVITEENFLRWVWDNRKRIKPAFVPRYCYKDDDYCYFVTTPYILGGYMFIDCDEYGIELSIAKDSESLGKSISKVSYGCNRFYVSTSSKKLWLKVYKWFNEQSQELYKKYGRDYKDEIFKNE